MFPPLCVFRKPGELYSFSLFGKNTENYPFVGDVIDQLEIGRTAFYWYFPPDRIRELRREHSEEVAQ